MSDLKSIIDNLSEDERSRLEAWLKELLEIRGSNRTTEEKLRAIVAGLSKATVLLPVIRDLGLVVKRHGWDERRKGFRWFLRGAGLSIAMFGFQGVGIAAFGGAVGLPLWIVFGGGFAAAHAILREMDAGREKASPLQRPHP